MLTRFLSVIAAASLPLIAVAQNVAAPLLPPEKISQIAGAMFQSYQIGNVSQMLSDENDCWEDAAHERAVSKKIVAACASAATAGAFIEATYARSQRRGANPQYTGEAIRARIIAKSGLAENETDDILASTVQPNISAILVGLKAAGMR